MPLLATIAAARALGQETEFDPTLLQSLLSNNIPVVLGMANHDISGLPNQFTLGNFGVGEGKVNQLFALVNTDNPTVENPALMWNGAPVDDSDLIKMEVGKDGIVKVPVVKDGKISPVWNVDGSVFFSSPVKAGSATGLRVSGTDADAQILVSTPSGTGTVSTKKFPITSDMKSLEMRTIGKGEMSSTYAKLTVSVGGDKPITWSQQAPGTTSKFDTIKWDLKNLQDKYQGKEIVASISVVDGSTTEVIGVGESGETLLPLTKGGLFSLTTNPLIANTNPGISIARLPQFSQKLDAVLGSSYSKGGLGIAILEGGNISFLKCYGYANENNQISFQPNSIIRLASETKILTSLSILRLASQGKINLDKPFMSYSGLSPFGSLPDERINSITVRQLLNMTSGWDSSKRMDRSRFCESYANKFKLKTPYTAQDAAKIIISSPLEHQPGEVQSYNNENYVLLGRIIENVSGQSYYDFVNNEIAKPIGITSLCQAATDISKRAPGEVQYYEENPVYGTNIFNPSMQVTRSDGALFKDRGDGNTLVNQSVCVEIGDSAGGLACSFTDFARLASVLNSNKLTQIVLPEYIRQISACPSNSESQSYFGLGMFIFREGNHANLVMGGVLHGVNLKLHSRPDGKMVVIAYNSNNEALNKVDNIVPKIHPILNGQ